MQRLLLYPLEFSIGILTGSFRFFLEKPIAELHDLQNGYELHYCVLNAESQIWWQCRSTSSH